MAARRGDCWGEASGQPALGGGGGLRGDLGFVERGDGVQRRPHSNAGFGVSPGACGARRGRRERNVESDWDTGWGRVLQAEWRPGVLSRVVQRARAAGPARRGATETQRRFLPSGTGPGPRAEARCGLESPVACPARFLVDPGLEPQGWSSGRCSRPPAAPAEQRGPAPSPCVRRSSWLRGGEPVCGPGPSPQAESVQVTWAPAGLAGGAPLSRGGRGCRRPLSCGGNAS